MIVNEAFARTREGDVIGRSLRFPGDTVARTVIGIAGNVRSWGLEDSEDRVQLYSPEIDRFGAYTRFLLRTSGPPAPIVQAARARIASLYPTVPLRQATTGPTMMRERTARIRFVAFLLASFAVLGVLFAIAGVYGTVSLDVSRRIREVGVRIALGASNTAVAVSTLRRGLQPVLVGALAGLAAAFWTAPALESVLYGVPARDPISAIGGAAILLLAGALACVLPAHRAARTDPASILRAS
jgi:hypothetical protein